MVRALAASLPRADPHAVALLEVRAGQEARLAELRLVLRSWVQVGVRAQVPGQAVLLPLLEPGLPRRAHAVHALLPMVPWQGQEAMDLPRCGRPVSQVFGRCRRGLLEVVSVVRHEDPEALVSAREVRLFSRQAAVDEEVVWPGLGRLFVYTRRCPAKATDNEDAVLVLRVAESQGVIAVADGVGGHPAGEQASARALECLLHCVKESLTAGESMRGAVLSGFDRANQAVLGLGAGSATTLAAITIDGPRIRAFHVGDSGILAFGGQGKVKLETIPHSPVGYGVEGGFIEAEDALEHEERHIVSNVVGDPAMHIGVSSPLKLRPRDRVLIASDGLFDNVAVEDAVDATRKGRLAAAIVALGATCRDRMYDGGRPDDLTIVAYQADAGS